MCRSPEFFPAPLGAIARALGIFSNNPCNQINGSSPPTLKEGAERRKGGLGGEGWAMATVQFCVGDMPGLVAAL